MTAILAVKRAAILTFVCAFFASGSAQEVVRNSQSNNVNGRSCGENQFACRNGECIASELLCDGRADCSDQSDETQVECTKPELTCPDYAFRCTYGACVNGDAVCNGVKDCIDNSDEALSRCPGISAADPEASCGIGDFRCRNGQCINSTSLCDGIVDCADQSDETTLACGSFPCSQLVFRCNYGACIDGDLTCNGVRNCADGSDEDPLHCGGSGTPGPVTPVTPTPTPPPTPRPSSRPPVARPSACLVPPQPSNGHWKLHRTLCSNELDCEIPQGVELEPGTQLVYTCNSNYKARGSTEVFCAVTGTWSKTPVCVEIKCSALNSPSTTAACSSKGQWVSCDSAVSPGTRAQLSCRQGYMMDTTSFTTRRTSVTCNANGKWEPDPVRCIPVCGIARTNQTPLVYNGVKATIGDFPWHATLYKEVNTVKGPKKEFQCGATIIEINLVLTAAHCVYDENTKTAVSPEKFFVVTGNAFRDYDSPLHDPNIVRKAEVKNVYLYCQYYGLNGNYASDIALLELRQPFVFSSILQPACLDVSGFSEQILEPGVFGRVAGFGRTASGTTSAVLQTLTLPYISYSQCKSSSNSSEVEVFISNDKFCAGYTNGSAVCEGDSGGGLVFKKNDLWYVMGVVSVGLGVDTSNGERTCDKYSYSLYTKVSTYMAWIQDVMFNLKQYQSFRSCGSNV
ncbi:modular serine protease [Neodiprion lecontei]|uniref:Modular serine protease n=1 Tax=Neodiprion lecontei TaxID=441921 RepID=A0A6J0C3M8_NEOLC|nr:modular serine protease [Neodiprion lecontei]